MSNMTYYYHGSPNDFKEFDYKRIGENGTSHGIGFYFTDNKDVAKGYAQEKYLYEVSLDGKKSLSYDELSFTKEDLRDILTLLHEKFDFLYNYGDVDYDGFSEVLESAVRINFEYIENDVDLLGSLYNTLGRDEDLIKFFYDYLGYDHIIVKPTWGDSQTIYIALTNDIIKIKNKIRVGDEENARAKVLL